jgi:hypothetical protein
VNVQEGRKEGGAGRDDGSYVSIVYSLTLSPSAFIFFHFIVIVFLHVQFNHSGVVDVKSQRTSCDIDSERYRVVRVVGRDDSLGRTRVPKNADSRVLQVKPKSPASVAEFRPTQRIFCWVPTQTLDSAVSTLAERYFAEVPYVVLVVRVQFRVRYEYAWSHSLPTWAYGGNSKGGVGRGTQVRPFITSPKKVLKETVGTSVQRIRCVTSRKYKDNNRRKVQW